MSSAAGNDGCGWPGAAAGLAGACRVHRGCAGGCDGACDRKVKACACCARTTRIELLLRIDRAALSNTAMARSTVFLIVCLAAAASAQQNCPLVSVAALLHTHAAIPAALARAATAAAECRRRRASLAGGRASGGAGPGGCGGGVGVFPSEFTPSIASGRRRNRQRAKPRSAIPRIEQHVRPSTTMLPR